MKNLIKKLWDSPTFTTWGNQAVQALRLLAVTPLILTQFDTTQIAAWYLFGSLSFFGVILTAQIGQTFSRMIAFAMGGATDLSPIRGKAPKRTDITPNWDLVQSVYSTTGSLNLFLVAIISAMALLMGWYGLTKPLITYADSSSVWISLGVVIISQALVFIFQQNTVALRGMNYIAMSNRWDMIFSLCSVFGGLATLKLGGKLLEVTIVMQLFILLAIPRNIWLLKNVEECRFQSFKRFALDRQIIKWAWEPTWKGCIIQLTSTGVISIASIFVIRYLPVSSSAALLFTLRTMQSLRSIADAPFISNGPRMSRLISESNTETLRDLVFLKTNQSQAIFGFLLIFLAVGGMPLLHFIGSNVSLIETNALLLFLILAVVQNQIFLASQLTAMGNNIICVNRGVISLLISTAIVILAAQHGNVTGVILGIFLPRIILFNIEPFVRGAALIDVKPYWVIGKLSMASIVIVTLLSVFAIWRLL